MNHRQLDKELFKKYLEYLVEYADRIISNSDVETEFELIMREYGLFLHRVINTTNFDEKLKSKVVAFDLFDKADVVDRSDTFVEGFLSRIPFFGTVIPGANLSGKVEKIKKCRNVYLIFYLTLKSTGFEINGCL